MRRSVWIAVCLCVAGTGARAEPRVFILDGAALEQVRARIQAGDAALQPAYAALMREAEKTLSDGPWSVMDKDLEPPSGDKHDYMSVGPYWWPDPDKDDGLPYIRRDGEVNPERNNYDNVGMGRMRNAVQTLALAYYLSGEERFAARAALLLRTWFLDPDTRMNPNLNFGQAIPGRCEGRCIGIIDTASLPDLVDAIGLLEGAEAWTRADQQGLEQWFGAYLDWLLESPHGRLEAKTRNNHATYYDAQVMAFALFARRPQTAERVAKEAGERRIATQIAPDGRQPHELARTKSFSYSCYNLAAFFDVAALARHAGVDLWRYETGKGASIRKALDWLAAQARAPQDWAYEQITGVHPERLAPLLRRAARAYNEPRYEQQAAALAGDDWASHRLQLLEP